MSATPCVNETLKNCCNFLLNDTKNNYCWTCFKPLCFTSSWNAAVSLKVTKTGALPSLHPVTANIQENAWVSFFYKNSGHYVHLWSCNHTLSSRNWGTNDIFKLAVSLVKLEDTIGFPHSKCQCNLSPSKAVFSFKYPTSNTMNVVIYSSLTLCIA